jgi:hypothetical protein
MLRGLRHRFDALWYEFRDRAARSGVPANESHEVYKQALAQEVREVLRAEGIELPK